MYSIIEFEIEKTLEIVPTSLIEGNMVYWPKRNGKKKVKNNELKDPLWTKYKMKIKREYG